MSTISDIIKRHPLLTFFVLAYGLTWVFLPLMGMNPYAPLVAAVIVVAITQGRSGVKTFLSPLALRWVKWPWYVMALGLPLILGLAALLLNILLGAAPPPADQLRHWPDLFLLIPIFIILVGMEEPGWTGYALPRLLVGRSALSASLIMGVLRNIWHLPLFLSGNIHWTDVPIMLAAQILITYLYLNTNRSVFSAMLIHASNGAIIGEFLGPMFSGADAVTFAWLKAILFIAAAASVVLLVGPKLVPPPAQPEAVSEPVVGV